MRGDDGRLYFQMLSHDLKQRSPATQGKGGEDSVQIRVFSFIMLDCFMLTYIVVLAM
jgi:hypothetical protein